MAICTTRTLEGMYIFSNPPKAVAAPISLKQAGRPQTFKSYRNSTIANNYRSVYSPNHFISGRPLSGYWWREKKETYEQQVNAAPPEDPVQTVNEDELKESEEKSKEKGVQDAVCQTETVQEVALTVAHSSSQTAETSNGDSNHTESGDFQPSDCRLTSQELLAQAEEMAQENEIFPLEIVTRVLSHSYIEDMIPNMLQKLKENGYTETADVSENEDVSVLPWLMNELELGLSRLEKSYNMLNQTTTTTTR